MRLLITGGPKTGKTTLAKQLGAQHNIPVRHTDELVRTHGWSEASDAVRGWLEEPGPWIIEGVAVPRALRKWYAAHGEEGMPADHVVLLDQPKVKRTAAQDSMAKGINTVWEEVAPLLDGSGVPVQRLVP